MPYSLFTDRQSVQVGPFDNGRLEQQSVPKHVAQQVCCSEKMGSIVSKVCLSTDLASPPGGPYSQIVTHDGLVYLAGCTPHAPGSGALVTGGFEEQATRAFENLQALAVAAGTDLSNALKVTVYLRDMANFQAMNQLFAKYLGAQPPVRTTLPVNLPGFEIEVDAIVAAG